MKIEKPNFHNVSDASSQLLPDQEYFVDILKGIMICSVILDHSFSHEFLFEYASPFWERIGIPVFLILMGYNLVKHPIVQVDQKLDRKFWGKYLKKKFNRFGFFYIFIYLVSGGVRLYISFFSSRSLYFYPSDDYGFLIFGYFPLWGPGSWFLPVLFSYIFFAPIFSKWAQRDIHLIFIVGFSVEIILQLSVFVLRLWFSANFPLYFGPNIVAIHFIFFYLSALCLGLWIGDKRTKGLIWVIYLFALGSFLFMIFYTFFAESFRKSIFSILTGDYHLLFFPYSAFLILFARRYLPPFPHSHFGQILQYIGRASYHVLLIQIFYFSLIYHFLIDFRHIEAFFGPWENIAYFLVNLMITVFGGCLFFAFENFLKRRYKHS